MIRFFFLGRALAQGQTDEPPAAKKKKLNDRGPMRQLSITQFFASKNENADSRDTFLCDNNNCSFSAREFDQLLMHKIKTHKTQRNFKVNLEYLFLCELCPSNPTSFHTKLDKVQHLISLHSRFIKDYCPSCKNYLPNLQSFISGHASYHESMGKHDWLNKDFKPFANLIDLLKNQKFACSDEKNRNKCILEPPKYSFHCPLCGENTRNKNSYQDHVNACIFKNKGTAKGGQMTTRSGQGREKSNENQGNSQSKIGNKKRPMSPHSVDPSLSPVKSQNDEIGTMRKKPDENQGNGQSKIDDKKRPMSPYSEVPSPRPAKSQNEEIGTMRSQIEDKMEPILYLMKKRLIRRGVGEVISFKSNEYNDDLTRMFFSLRSMIKDCLRTALQTTGQIKVVPNLITLFKKENPIYNLDDESLALTKLRHLLISAQEIDKFTDLNAIIDNWQGQFENRVEQFCENESGFYVLDFVSLELKIFPFKSFINAGQLKTGFEPLPTLTKFLGRKSHIKILYPQNLFDAECSLYCVAIQLQAMKNDFFNSKTNLKKLNQQKDFDDNFLSQYCPMMISSLREKLKHFKFPMSLNKVGIKNFIKAVDLPQFCLNFFYFDEETKNIIPLHVGSSMQILKNCLQNELGPQWESSLNEKNERMKRIKTNFTNSMINLLFYPIIQESKTTDFHCALILDFELLVKPLGKKNKYLKCLKCYSSFKNLKPFFLHLSLCERYNTENLILTFPTNVKNEQTGKLEPPKIKFNEHLGRERMIYSSVIDFETRFVHVMDGQRELVPAMGFYYLFLNVKIFENDNLEAKRIKEKPFPHLVFEGAQCAENLLLHFKENLLEARNRIDRLKQIYSKCVLSKKDQERVRLCKKCERCGVIFSDKKGNAFGPIRDHSHYAPNCLRALLCQKCNLSSRVEYSLNLTGFNNIAFDNKIILKAIFQLYKKRTPFHYKISVIPLTMENYLCIKIQVFCDKCHIIDKQTGVMSYGTQRCHKRHITVIITDARKYWNTSLDSLIDSYSYEVQRGEKLAQDVFPLYHKFLNNMGLLSFIDFNLAIQKQFFPYDHWTVTQEELDQGTDSFLARTCLPPRAEWKNSFWKDDEILGEREYNCAQRTWNDLSQFYASRGETMTMRQYTFYYNISDVLLLSDILSSASNRYFELFQLEILAFPSLASFSQSIFMNILQREKLSIELITDPDIYLMAKNACVGGLVGTGEHRLISCNNPLLPDYDKKKPITILKHWDVNGLYTSSMKFYSMPRGKYRLLDENEIKKMFIDITQNHSYKQWGDEGYRSEIDPISGNRIHFGFTIELTVTLISDSYKERYADLPLFEEKRSIPPTWLSPYQKKLYAELGRKLPDKTTRIMLTLHEKTVTCDFRYLRFALQLGGYRVVSIKRVIEFELYPFMRSYMEEFIKMRKNSKTKVEDQMAKNLCNIQFGKKLESKEGRLDCKFVFSDEHLQKNVRCPQFLNYIEFDQEVGICVKKQKNVYVDTLPLVGFTILSLSKLIFLKNIYSVYLSAFLPYEIRVKICYFDTDSCAAYHELDRKETTLNPFWDALRSISCSMDYFAFPTTHVLFSDPNLSPDVRSQLLRDRENNRKQIGLFSSEIGDRVVTNAAFIQPKSYCINFLDGTHKMAMKGARINKLDLNMDMLHKFVLGKGGKHLTYDHVYIHSKRQDLFISKTRKNILNRLYVKRYMLDGNRSLSYGHPLIEIHQIINEMLDKVVHNVDKN